MKNIYLFLFMFLLMTGSAMGYANQCGDAYNCPDRFCSTCQCVDLGRHLNDCITDRKFCEAFGNIGAR